jgi:hypothetical protein
MAPWQTGKDSDLLGGTCVHKISKENDLGGAAAMNED